MGVRVLIGPHKDLVLAYGKLELRAAYPEVGKAAHGFGHGPGCEEVLVWTQANDKRRCRAGLLEMGRNDADGGLRGGTPTKSPASVGGVVRLGGG